MKNIMMLFMLVLSMNLAAKEIEVKDEHPVCSNVKYASTDIAHYDNVYGESFRRMAREGFVYALMASNAYEDYEDGKPEFTLPGWEKVDFDFTKWRGMGAHVYKSKAPPEQVAIVFEGTNATSVRDWLFGNLNVFWKGQYGDAEDLIDRVAEAYPTARLTTAGHSLGGGLAIHAALHHAGLQDTVVPAYAFNSSPRIFSMDNVNNTNSSITLISENDDILEELRKRWGTLDELENVQFFKMFDFLDLETNDNNKISEHSMYHFARGLIMVAANVGDQDAEEVLASFTSPETTC